ncbi:polyphenol oxidase [Vigna unguiculata]|uniref:Polyphenol oxidase n=1 Tax=Vigna unguiculata TaxID=3917 RepID=A0A4D6KJM6_VIGUN|nr:polyphenol oxidase [Vigna unguiculata]QCD76720.1 polyphenol oxidase [Vigna unguiculata]
MASLYSPHFSISNHSFSVTLFRNQNLKVPKVGNLRVSCKTTKGGNLRVSCNKATKGDDGDPKSQKEDTFRRDTLSLADPISAVLAAETSKTTKFPVILDSSVSTVVKRPKKNKNKREEEEVLVIEGIEFERGLVVKFDVYIKDKDNVAGGPTKAEFAGSFMSMAHHKHKMMKTKFMLGISELLEDLDAEDDEYLFVTLVPKMGKGHVTVQGIKIEFQS